MGRGDGTARAPTIAAPCRPCQRRAHQGRQRALPRRRRRDLRLQVGHRLRRRSARTRSLAKLRKALGGWPAEPFGDALEIGAGTGYFSLNLLQAGAIERATATDISPGMLDGADGERQAPRPRGGDGARPRPRASPSRTRASTSSSATRSCTTSPTSSARFGEFHRVLRPGGTIAFCGEPSRYGDLLAGAAQARRAAGRAALAAALSAPATRDDDAEHRRQRPRARGEVDVHAFAPGDLALRSRRRLRRRPRPRRGAARQRATAGPCARSRRAPTPSRSPGGWRKFAFRSYLALQKVDTRGARAPPAAAALLQPAALGPQAGLEEAWPRRGSGLEEARSRPRGAGAARSPVPDVWHRAAGGCALAGGSTRAYSRLDPSAVQAAHAPSSDRHLA